KAPDGSIAGGPMYYMKKRLWLKLPSGRTLRFGKVLAALFAVATVFSSFGTGNLPQVNSIANSLWETFSIPHLYTGIVLSILLAFVIVGGIKRIAKVTQALVPAMALIYFAGAILVIAFNYDNIWPSMVAVVKDVFTGSAASGGFLGASIAFAFNRGVNRGLFSNEAGQGSAPIAHAAARAHEPVSEGLVALLEPFIDTIIICSITGMTLLASGVWQEKHENLFQTADMEILDQRYHEDQAEQLRQLADHVNGSAYLPLFSGQLDVVAGKITNEVSLLHARSLAEDVKVQFRGEPYTGSIRVRQGKPAGPSQLQFHGRSLIHSAPLTTIAFSRSWLGPWGKYIVAIGLLLFAFSTAISWSYYGGRAMVYLFGLQSVLYYKIVYVIGFFLAAILDTSLIWIFSGITIALMTIPNLLGMLWLHKEVKSEVKSFWNEYAERFPDERPPNY
ncbi:MAG TPA: amino acid carrier protein, partial [Cyclobacteriaceae bacterium]|nr:amino acid carrier protein [Cyclobacteriaceae bacterium]